MASHFTQAVRLALAAGDYRAAQRLAEEGAATYSEDSELQEMARLLAPPTVTVSRRPPDPGIRANREWLGANGPGYAGRWVALRNGQLLAVGDTRRQLLAKVGDTANTGILVTKVY